MTTYNVGDKVVIYPNMGCGYLGIPEEGAPGVIVKAARIKLTIEYSHGTGPRGGVRTGVFRSDNQQEESRHSSTMYFMTDHQASEKNRVKAVEETLRKAGLKLEPWHKLTGDQAEEIAAILTR